MASRGVLLKALYNQFYALTGELREMFPEDPDFLIFENAIRLLEKTNPGLMLHYYKTNVTDTGFSRKIAERDESFFLDYHYAEYNEAVGADVIGKLKEYWNVLSPESRSAVWAYISAIDQVCVRLSKSD